VLHEGGGYLVRTNSHGFRSEFEFVRAKPATTKRLLLFGDSYTAGDGVSNKYRYSDQLMSIVANLEIYNFGMPGTGTDQQYLIFRELAHQFDHDAIIIAVLVENIRRVNSRYRFYFDENHKKVLFSKPYFELDNDNLVLKGIPVSPNPVNSDDLSFEDREKIDEGGKFVGLRSMVKKLGLQEVSQILTRYQPLPEYNDAKNKEWLLLKRILENWISESKKPVFLVPLPIYSYVEETSDYRRCQERFAEFSNLGNVVLFDPYDDLVQYSLTERRNFRFKDDPHPSASGHAAIATSLSGVLSKHT
jgi:carbamoyltransferase